jgi:hypothetical protein
MSGTGDNLGYRKRGASVAVVIAGLAEDFLLKIGDAGANSLRKG